MNLVLTEMMIKRAKAEGLLRVCPACGRKHRVAPARKAATVKCPECGTSNPPPKAG